VVPVATSVGRRTPSDPAFDDARSNLSPRSSAARNLSAGAVGWREPSNLAFDDALFNLSPGSLEVRNLSVGWREEQGDIERLRALSAEKVSLCLTLSVSPPPYPSLPLSLPLFLPPSALSAEKVLKGLNL